MLFEEGAHWIHGAGPKNPLTSLAQMAHIHTTPTDDERTTVYKRNGKAYKEEVLRAIEKEWKGIKRVLQTEGGEQEDVLHAFNRLYPGKIEEPIWKYILSAYLEFDTGATLQELSALNWDEDSFYQGPEALVTNGYDQLPAHLAKGLTIQLNSMVKRMDYREDEILVYTQDKAPLIVDAVVVTLPLGVLQQGAVAFLPALPKAKKAAIQQVKMGVVNKFLLVWETSFWEQELHYIGYTPDVLGKFNYFLNGKVLEQPNALMTFSYGTYAKEAELLSDQAIIEACMSSLRAIYGKNIPEPIKLLRTGWGQDPYSFGAYSFCGVGTGEQEVEELAAPVGEKLFFAGEHTSFDYRGTVHGAYWSGLRAAKEVKQSF